MYAPIKYKIPSHSALYPSAVLKISRYSVCIIEKRTISAIIVALHCFLVMFFIAIFNNGVKKNKQKTGKIPPEGPAPEKMRRPVSGGGRKFLGGGANVHNLFMTAAAFPGMVHVER